MLEYLFPRSPSYFVVSLFSPLSYPKSSPSPFLSDTRLTRRHLSPVCCCCLVTVESS